MGEIDIDIDRNVGESSYQLKLNSRFSFFKGERITTQLRFSTINNWISEKCLFRYPIGGSEIRLSPISLITDIGQSAHLWYFYWYFTWPESAASGKNLYLSLSARTLLVYRSVLSLENTTPDRSELIGGYLPTDEAGREYYNDRRKFKTMVVVWRQLTSRSKY